MNRVLIECPWKGKGDVLGHKPVSVPFVLPLTARVAP
jgi:hypothetical protein